VVLVEVLAVRAVVDPMVRRRVDDSVEWAEAADDVGVDPELIGLLRSMKMDGRVPAIATESSDDSFAYGGFATS
jgi:hypothetical protein